MRWNLVLTSFSSLLLAGLPAAHAAQPPTPSPQPLLTHGICGSVETDGTPVPDRLNPSFVLGQFPVQQLMLDLASPATRLTSRPRSGKRASIRTHGWPDPTAGRNT
jgi:hypothetical protein